MIKKIIYISFMISIFIPSAIAADFNALMEKSPVITIDNDNAGKFKSVTVYTVADAPLETIWNVILDVNAYREFNPRMETVKIVSRDDATNELTAEFVIDAPLVNMKYSLLFKFDRKSRTIKVERLSGDLEGSSWLWKFEENGNRTLIIYSGVIRNFFPLIEKWDDEKSSITIGVTISTLVSTVRTNRERAEFLYKNSQTGKNAGTK